MSIENKTLRILYFVFLAVHLLDLVTCFFILDGEANPIFLLTGNIWFLVLLKIGVVTAVYFFMSRNKYPSNFVFFTIILILVLSVFSTSLGVLSNIRGMFNPVIVQEASVASGVEKASAYFLFIGLVYILPFALSLVAFAIYRKALKHAYINKLFFKNRKWWKF